MISIRSLLVIISSWMKRVEKGNHGNRYDYDYHESMSYDCTNVTTSHTTLRSTGKGAKKRRADVLTEEAAEAEESDDEDD